MTESEQPAPAWLDELMLLRQRRVALIEDLEKLRKSKVFVLWNLDELRYEDFYSLADMLDDEAPSRDLDLVLMSNGGNGEAGYRIGHAFQQWAQRKDMSFRVIIPLYAKSAATILALGAHEIVMGLHSEIGPIDPQVPRFDPDWKRTRYLPAMGIADGLKLVGDIISQFPATRPFFEELLHKPWSLDELGELERARESGKQYAELLLMGGGLPDDRARTIAARFADYYKFHGHPIDAFDAEDLGLKVSRSTGQEWQAIKALRDEFQNFAGKPRLIPGLIVVSIVESTNNRSWRYIPLESDAPASMPT